MSLKKDVSLEDKNIHKNHRQRLFSLVEKVGFENLNSINALEFLLTFVIPRKDTNPIAHRLLQKFGSIQNIFKQEKYSLASVEGLGERSASLLLLLYNFFEYNQKSNQQNEVYLKNFADMKKYFIDLYKFSFMEEFHITLLNERNKILFSKKISQGSLSKVSISKTEVLKLVLTTNAKKVILSHCHPDGKPDFSGLDYLSNSQIVEILKQIDIEFIDHIVVGKDNSIFSFNHDRANESFV